MNGAESLIRTFAAHDLSVCFANPGTSEMHLVQAIDSVPECRAVLCLFEGVCTGAADGYARLAGGPAATLLHLGAGIHHVPYDAPLTSDIEAVAKPVSAWIRTSRTAEGLTPDGRRCRERGAAPRPNPRGGVAILIVPAGLRVG